MNTIWEVQGDSGILKLNNPPQNYLDEPDFLDLGNLKNVIKESGVKGIIITGYGRHFSGGANLDNLKDLAKKPELLNEKISKGIEILNFLDSLEIPLIAAVNGVCFGGGLEIALSCHIKIAESKALFAFPESNYNLLPGLGGISRMHDLADTNQTMQMVLHGDVINAEKALEIKLIDYLVSSKELFGFSINLMDKMTNGRPLKVINSIIRSINNAKKMSFEQSIKEETALFCKLAIEEADKI
ncbi:MAG: enoyl-CoA hydratase/isomerase family protein [Bacteroidetes bacterium]|nr:enoyl-CoA hydratase/isomerase family protein [Bacteroidota bacterium]